MRYAEEQARKQTEARDAQGQKYLDTERRLYEAEKADERQAAENARQRAHAMRVVQTQMAGSSRANDTAAEHNPAQVTVDALDELSARINTQSSIAAKAGGVWSSVQARANHDDGVAEYEAFVAGAIPLVARKTSHVGVLTELDVQSVKAMSPKVGDSKTLRERKMARIRSIMNMPAQSPTLPGAPTGRGVGAGPGPAPVDEGWRDMGGGTKIRKVG